MKAQIGDYVTLIHSKSSFGTLSSTFLSEEGYDSELGVPVINVTGSSLSLLVRLPSGYELQSDVKEVLKSSP